MQGALGRCSSEDLAPLYAKFVRNGTYVTPTFTAQVEVAMWPTHEVPGDSLAHYLPKALRDYVAEIFPMPDSIPPNADSVGRAMLEKRLRQVAAMQRAGVHILTGTDAPLRNSPPGFGLHEELALLVRGGMSPFEVLRVGDDRAGALLRHARLGGNDRAREARRPRAARRESAAGHPQHATHRGRRSRTAGCSLGEDRERLLRAANA